MALRWKRGGKGGRGDGQANTGDPNTEGDWKPTGMLSGGKATRSGLIRLLPQPHPSGQVYVTPLPRSPFTPPHSHLDAGAHRRFKSVRGAWSDPAQIRAG